MIKPLKIKVTKAAFEACVDWTWQWEPSGYNAVVARGDLIGMALDAATRRTGLDLPLIFNFQYNLR